MNLFEVQPEDIARLSARPFTDVLNHLLQAEANRLSILPSGVDTTLRITVPDGGVDAAVKAPNELVGRWIPAGYSVWQYKSGGIKTHKEMKKEFNKPGVQEALDKGGIGIVSKLKNRTFTI